MHIIFYNHKGGCGKSTLCEFTARALEKNNFVVSSDTTDQQIHIKIRENKKSDFYLYDTSGSYTKKNETLLYDASKEKHKIIIPIGIGENDFIDFDFLINRLKENNVFKNSYFVFCRVRGSSKLLEARKKHIMKYDCNVCSWFMPNLKDFSILRNSNRTINEMNLFINEVIL